jgi:hypothetical protein
VELVRKVVVAGILGAGMLTHSGWRLAVRGWRIVGKKPAIAGFLLAFTNRQREPPTANRF